MKSSIRNCNCGYFPPCGETPKRNKHPCPKSSPVVAGNRFLSISSNHTLRGLAPLLFPIAPRPIFHLPGAGSASQRFRNRCYLLFLASGEGKSLDLGSPFFWCGLSVACLWVPFLVLLFSFAWLVEQGASERDASVVHHQ